MQSKVLEPQQHQPLPMIWAKSDQKPLPYFPLGKEQADLKDTKRRLLREGLKGRLLLAAFTGMRARK